MEIVGRNFLMMDVVSWSRLTALEEVIYLNQINSNILEIYVLNAVHQDPEIAGMMSSHLCRPRWRNG